MTLAKFYARLNAIIDTSDRLGYPDIMTRDVVVHVYHDGVWASCAVLEVDLDPDSGIAVEIEPEV